ncbi:SURF1 family cytochrome oxidase biogenesis protein [Lolliginicoccus levis]|uniref:SURF1 family cytochrome oxidase biogenesis protein n=1 Tax=Lolliginicoccus levis TaxID=2919542 RepID=UPI0024203E99|nr:SURF1 family protein [Lolliginicoccus levis]
MRRLGFLVRPGWVVLILIVGMFAYLAFTVLAPWQLGKNAETEQRNSLIEQSLDAAPVPVGELMTDQAAPPADSEWRRVLLTGSYLPADEVVARLRSVDATPGFEVLTPFQLESGPVVLVNRGFVPTDVGTEVPGFAAPPEGQVQLEGRVRMPEGSTGRDVIDGADGVVQVYSINPREISAATGADLPGFYVQLAADQPGGLGVIGLPQLDAGPFLSYGLQWIAFGIMAPLGLLYFVRAELRERRGRGSSQEAVATEDEANDDGSTEPGAADLGTSAPGPAKPSRPRDVLADRYGHHR